MLTGMIDIAPEVLELQSLIWRNKLRVSQVMRRANVAPSTWTRWATGAQPNTATLRKVRGAIEELTA